MASSDVDLPAGYRSRPATLEDLPAIDAVFLASEHELAVLPEPRASFLRWLWSQPYADADRDARVIVGPGGIAGFMMAWHDDATPSVLHCMGRVHPAHAGRGLGAGMLSWYAGRARDFAGVKVQRLVFPEEDATGHALVRSGGYERVRTSFDMGATLPGVAPHVPAPAGVTIRQLLPGRDEYTFWRVETEAFRDHWDYEADPPYAMFAAEWFGGSDPSHVLLAEADGSVVGECGWTVENEAYVASLGVIRSHRGRGIATALLSAAMTDAAALGHRRISLSVDAANPTGALRVYEKAGMSVWRTTAIFDRPAG